MAESPHLPTSPRPAGAGGPLKPDDLRVAVAKGIPGYPALPPFDPPERYPELGNGSVDRDNRVYAAVRELLIELGRDADRLGMPDWNPLGGVVEPGMTVLVKPNAVRHDHIRGKTALSVITHASVIRPLLDYVTIALRGRGRIIVGDAPMLFGDFAAALETSGLAGLLASYRGDPKIPIDCFDLRSQRATRTWLRGDWGRERVGGDPRGHRWVDLGRRSRFAQVDPARLRISVANSSEMLAHHRDGRHEYLLPGSLLASDAIISVPKLKTHRRTGVTLTMKGFLGLVGGRGSQPHFQLGSVREGGDEYLEPSARKRLRTAMTDRIHGTSSVPLQFLYAVGKTLVSQTTRVVPFPDPVEDGMWYGNDTLWRTVLDVQEAVLYADASGMLRDTPQRTHFAVVDGVVAGEGIGPLEPDPVEAGVLVGGTMPCIVDSVAAALMGFDPERIPVVAHGVSQLEARSRRLRDEVRVAAGGDELTLAQFLDGDHLGLRPHPQWAGHIEREAWST